MRINTNVSALNAWRNLYMNDTSMTKSMEKLSSGFRINRAADDAAGLAISEKMKAQIGGLNVAVRNAQDGISLIQTAEGALNETQAMLQRMRDLAVQASNSTLTVEDRYELQKELNQLTEQIQQIGVNTEFNTLKLLDGTYKTQQFHIGANADQTLKVDIGDMRAAAIDASGTLTDGALDIASSSPATVTLYGEASITVNEVTLKYVNSSGAMTETTAYAIDITSSVTAAEEAISVFDKALVEVSAQRADLGAVQNRLEHTINNLQVSAENLAAANSRIRDVDMAQEMTNFTRQQILLQAGTAMLAQANLKPQSVLQLLG